MKALFIGGTGNISSDVSRLAVEQGIDLYHLNRGNREKIPGVTNILADVQDIHTIKHSLEGHEWDVVVNWVAFQPQDIERDFELFKGRTSQYIFISTASAYQKPPVSHIITEKTPVVNPYWEYSRNKISCEEKLYQLHVNEDFPITIVRPSHTYNTVIPVTLGGWTEYTVVDRMKKGLPVVVQGDGTSLWTITHAKDFAKGFLGLMGNKKSVGEAYHITSDEVLSWNQIYELVANAAETSTNIIHIASETIADYADLFNYPSVRGTLLGDKSYSAIFDNSKIKTLVPGFKAEISFAEGIKGTLNWFQAKPERMIVNPTTNAFLDGLIESSKRYFI